MSPEEFIEFASSATKEQLFEFANSLEIGAEYDYYSKSHWGHNFEPTDRHIGEYVHRACVFSQKVLKVGDILLCNSSSGRVGKYLILNLEQMRNPRDQFFVWIVCCGYK
jgi:hypothetical protein